MVHFYLNYHTFTLTAHKKKKKMWRFEFHKGFGHLLTSGFKILYVASHSLRNAFIGANFDSIWEQNRSPLSAQPPAVSLCGRQKLSLSDSQGRICGLLRQESGDCTHGVLHLFCRKHGPLLPRTEWEHNQGLRGMEAPYKR